MIRFFTPLKLLLLATLAAAVVAGFILIPAGTSLPVHWNIAGEPDGYWPREWALLVPVGVTLLVWGIFAGVDRFARPEDREPGAYVASVALTALTALTASTRSIVFLSSQSVDCKSPWPEPGSQK